MLQLLETFVAGKLGSAPVFLYFKPISNEYSILGAVLQWECKSQLGAGVLISHSQLHNLHVLFTLLCLFYSGGFTARSDLAVRIDRMQRATVASTRELQLHTSSVQASVRMDYFM